MKNKISSINFLQLFFDLIIVFIGVYTAFWFSSRQEEQKQIKDAGKLIEILKIGMERYEELFTGMADYHDRINAEFKAKLDNGTIPDFSSNYYVEPQYPVDVIRYILTNESYQFFTADLYIPLTQYVHGIQRLMTTERKLVSLSEMYEPLPSKDHPDYERVYNRQLVLAKRCYRYLQFRKNICRELNGHIQVINASVAQLDL